ncbi:cytidylyltransferase domain-containing protein [Heyndrickxia vini]|uniref:Acylneuraminate cytidylyltransferase family protein n=1 Tax=Heyndrickxia vini TaxID=1476025 RepID=A0ABX7E3I0_9BACI|nr:acylneuraminate cytidylyltransferase family protein [Heyndrickxia vini]QQZ10276.1 acylneuraminate cytidylyltransferase family protein [Heyndrickxia vini]
MYKGKKFLAIIPARGGSKGIPNKNIVNVNGKPLIQYTIEEAINSNFIDEVIVSTDNIEIASISKQLGANIPFLRPSYLAEDDSKTIDTLLYVIEEIKKLGCLYDYVVLLQPTQPLRKVWHIDNAIKKIIESKQNSLVSISKVNDHPIFIRTIKPDNTLENLLDANSTLRRQELPPYYKINGAIYINKIIELNQNTSLNDNTLGFIMDSKYDLDVDTHQDLDLLKYILQSI